MTVKDILLSLLGTPTGDVAPLIDTPSGESRMLIDGKLTHGDSGAMLPNINPATEEVIGEVADAGMNDVRRATAAARRAFDDEKWRSDAAFRQRCLQQLQDGLRVHADEFRASLVAEIGCARRMTYADQYDFAVDKLGFYVDELGSMAFGRDLPATQRGDAQIVKRVEKIPAGVVAAITPWNLPVELILAKVGAALAVGCTMVVKPSPLSPWSGTLLGRIIAEETEIPAGVMNVIVSSEVDVARYLTTSPDIDMIAFTGSTHTGRAVMKAAGDGLKRVSLELGGKSACIILDDLDIDQMVPIIAGMACFNAGQSCIMPSRMLVPRNRFDQFVAAATFGISQVSVGDPRSLDTFMGPLISAEQRTRVESLVARGVSEGASVLAGAGRPGELNQGYFFSPTLVASKDPQAILMHEEVFGPVISIFTYDNEDEAVAIANNTEFGLAGYVWSDSTERAAAVARRLRVGMLGVNGAMFTDADMPFGGVSSSGMGREWGVEGMEEFLNTRTIAMRVPN